MALRWFEIACRVTPKVSVSSSQVWHESWSNNVCKLYWSPSAFFVADVKIAASKTSELVLARSSYASHNNQCLLAALFFGWKQKSSASRKLCFIGTMVDMVRAQSMLLTLQRNNTYWFLEGNNNASTRIQLYKMVRYDFNASYKQSFIIPSNLICTPNKMTNSNEKILPTYTKYASYFIRHKYLWSATKCITENKKKN